MANTLHEAIALVLTQVDNTGLTARQIAYTIEEQELWRRPSDGHFPPPSQVSARLGTGYYRHLFRRERPSRLVFLINYDPV